jgi:hypothetical protein
MSQQSTVYENELIDQTLTAMLWSPRAANIARSALHISAFAGRAALAALIADHDQDHANSALEGVDRVQSIVRSIINRADDVQRARDDHDAWILGRQGGPEPISPYCPAVSMIAYRDGAPDPLLLSRARHVLTYLPTLVAPAGLQPSHGTITHLVHQLTFLADQAGTRRDGRSPGLGRGSGRARRIKSGTPLGSARQHRRPRISSCHPPTRDIAAYDTQPVAAAESQLLLDFC